MGGDCTIPTLALELPAPDTDVPAGCVRLQLVLPFPDSRRQKAEVPAVCVKAGQRPPRIGRRALTQTAPRLHSRYTGNGRDWFLFVCIWGWLRQNLLSPAMFLCLHLPHDFLVLFGVQPLAP